MTTFRGSGTPGAGEVAYTQTDLDTAVAEAAASEAAAAASESAAATSESNAATSETNAAASESAAATSESNAAASEAAAAASESAAATSESNAATSESNAATSESNAATYASNASASADAAAVSAASAASTATFENLDANGDVGTGAAQVAQGNHLHTGVYEPADATILKDADIGSTVEAYDATILKDADIGSTVEAYDATILKDADISDTVAPFNLTMNNQTGTTYTLVLADAGKNVTLNNASAITLTIPANASVAFPVGTTILLTQLGAGQVTVSITTDTLNVTSTFTAVLAEQYSEAVLTKKTSTMWVISGDLEAA